MLRYLFLFELKRFQADVWHLIIMGGFIFCLLFCSSLMDLSPLSAMTFILFLSTFLTDLRHFQEDREDGTLALLYHTSLSLEFYGLSKIGLIWCWQYLIQVIAISMGSIFFTEPMGKIGWILMLWAPVSAAFVSLLSVLRLLLQKQIGLHCILVLPFILPLLLFYQGSVNEQIASFAIKMLCAISMGLMTSCLLLSAFLLKRTLSEG